MKTPISLSQIEKSYPSGLSRIKILHGISLEISKGEVFGFIGPNGAGKSTLINLLMGFTRPDSGTIKIHGIAPKDPAARQNIGYLPEGPRFYENLNSMELMRFGCAAAGMKGMDTDDHIERLLDLLEILHVKAKPISTYSKGMKQRLGLALAMIHNPDTLILDEPMSGLDPMGRNLLKRIILDLKSQGKTIFFSSHILNDVEVLCDRIGVIHQGNILFSGVASDFRQGRKDLEEAFVHEIGHASKERHANG